MTSNNPTSGQPNRATASAPRTDENQAQRAPPPGGPFDPRDGGTDKPSIKSIWDVIKIVTAVTAWYTTSDAASALREAARYTELGRAISLLHLTGVPNIVLWGALLGFVHGFILSIKAVVFIWAGPAFFEFLYPAFVAASRISSRVATDLRKAWSTGPVPLDTTNNGNQPTRGNNGETGNRGDSTSDTGSKQPADEETKPTDEPAKPGVEPAKPGVEPAKPGVEPAKPGVEPAKPSDEPAKPDDDSSKSDDSSKKQGD